MKKKLKDVCLLMVKNRLAAISPTGKKTSLTLLLGRRVQSFCVAPQDEVLRSWKRQDRSGESVHRRPYRCSSSSRSSRSSDPAKGTTPSNIAHRIFKTPTKNQNCAEKKLQVHRNWRNLFKLHSPGAKLSSTHTTNISVQF